MPKNLRPRPKPFPLLPLAAAFLLLVGVAQIIAWGVQAFKGPEAARAPQVGNPFGAMAGVQQRHAAARKVAEFKLQRVAIPAGPPLATLGSAEGPVLLTLLLDPSKANQRRQMQKWLAPLPKGVKIEVRYAPANSGSVGAGVLFKIAQDEGRMPTLWRALFARPDDVDETTLLTLMAQQGADLNALRTLLSQPTPAPMAALQPTLAWLAAHRLASPMVLLDGFVVNSPAMSPMTYLYM
jgi:hypothetical protein